MSKDKNRKIFTYTLIEILLIIIFILILILQINYVDFEKAKGNLRHYSELEDKLKSIGITLDDIPKYWTFLVDIRSQDQMKLKLAEEINKLKREKESLENEITQLRDKRSGLEREIGDLVKRKTCAEECLPEKGKGGRDSKPCWEDSSGKLQYLFNIEVFDKGYEVTSIYPDSRIDDALLLGLESKFSGNFYTYSAFKNLSNKIYDFSVQNNCRYYVKVKYKTKVLEEHKRNEDVITNSYYYLKTD